MARLYLGELKQENYTMVDKSKEARERVVTWVRDTCGDAGVQALDKIINQAQGTPRNAVTSDEWRPSLSPSSDFYERFPGVGKITLLG
jgi:hypothetical protein